MGPHTIISRQLRHSSMCQPTFTNKTTVLILSSSFNNINNLAFLFSIYHSLFKTKPPTVSEGSTLISGYGGFREAGEDHGRGREREFAGGCGGFGL